MEEWVCGRQSGYCERYNEIRDNYIEIRVAIAIGNHKFPRCERFDCPEQDDCECVDDRGRCSFVISVLNRFARG